MEEIEEKLTAPNKWDAVRKAPAWWTDDDDAWSGWATAAKA